MGIMDKRIRDIYLIYLGLTETAESLDQESKQNKEYLWYKGNIIELHDVIDLLKEIKR